MGADISLGYYEGPVETVIERMRAVLGDGLRPSPGA
jgi:hypothetical protein